ncbi:hypothetical protein AAFC00_003318 [Neodothiora populina]|uniref:Glycosyltransferase family 25 protein n=1 Tax=Neodothiora populina TaxID=2781224 RepID=A0ABR3PA10_9PEZI
MELRRRRLFVIVAFCALVFLIYSKGDAVELPSLSGLERGVLHRHVPADSIQEQEPIVEEAPITQPALPPGIEPANSTLGFGAIVAVSHATSPRRQGLLAAAYITDLNISIPDQPAWTDEDVDRLRRPPKETRMTRGSALAWLGHLNALRWFLSTDLETVLILEDDVDWDIRLRTQQVPRVAAAARTLTAREAGINQTSSRGDKNRNIVVQESSFMSTASAGGYWGETSGNASWDLMYLGHCGDRFYPETWNDEIRSKASFEDPSVPPLHSLHTFTRRFLTRLGIGTETRILHKSINPLCTFGFALTRHAAYRLLHEIAPREQEGGCQAYDVRILETCRDKGFRCWTVTPELFHHQDAASMIAGVDKAAKTAQKSREQLEDADDERERLEKSRTYMSAEERKKFDKESARLQKEKEDKLRKDKEKLRLKLSGVDDRGRLMGAAQNIRCGIRGAGMFSEDPSTLEYLREVVGVQGRCLRDEMAEDMSRWP